MSDEQGPSRLVVGGLAYRAVAASLAAWMVKGDLATDEFEGQRQALLDAAVAVDSARAAMEAGEGSIWVFGNLVRMLNDALAAVAKGTAKVGDDTDATIAAILGSGPTRD